MAVRYPGLQSGEVHFGFLVVKRIQEYNKKKRDKK